MIFVLRILTFFELCGLSKLTSAQLNYTHGDTMATKRKFVAEIEWGYSNDDIDDDRLHPDLKEAKRLWKKKDKAAFPLIAKHIRCVFLPDSVSGDIAEILEVDDEIVSREISLTGADFSDGNLPKVKATAEFMIPVVEGVGQDEVDEWQDSNDMLDNAISFEWDFPELDEEDLDLASWNHEGLSFALA
jgi:hypothetical protein